jgi:hypothetical protein
MSGAITIDASPAPAPGHGTDTGEFAALCCATTLAPLIVSVAV